MIVVLIIRSPIINDRQGKMSITDGSDRQLNMSDPHDVGEVLLKEYNLGDQNLVNYCFHGCDRQDLLCVKKLLIVVV